MKKVLILLGIGLWVAVLIGGTLFLAAGSLAQPLLWVNLSVWVTGTMLAGLAMDLDLMRERAQTGPGNSKGILQALGLPVVMSPFIIAGLDVGRFHWSDGLPLGVQLVSLGVVLLGFGLVAWAIQVNRFFAKAVRIQEDRGQKVIVDGPYRYVRHPGYVGFSLIFLACGSALGSWLAAVPAVGLVGFFIWRTGVEDDMLHRSLEGYAEYAVRVRYRLIPGVW